MAKLAFEKAKKKIIFKEKWHLKQYDNFDADEQMKEHMVSFHSSTVQFLNELTFERLQAEYKNIVTKGIALYK